MKSVEVPGLGHEIQCKTSESLAKALLSEELKLTTACGRNGLCATCHVIVTGGFEDGLTPITEKEEKALARLADRQPNSRLSCQAKVIGDVKVRLPDGEYLQSADTLLDKIGKRAEKNLLHPETGKILVMEGQLITRYVVRQLEGADLAPWATQSRLKQR